MVQNGLGLQKFTKLVGQGLHGNHPAYDDVVEHLMNKFKEKNPSFSPEQAKVFLETKLIPELKYWIIKAKNTDMNLNNYFKDIVKPFYKIK